MQMLSMASRGWKSTKLCGNLIVYITSIIVMLITILLMIEDQYSNTNFAHKNACYVSIISLIIIVVENGCKTNSFFYFKTPWSAASSVLNLSQKQNKIRQRISVVVAC